MTFIAPLLFAFVFAAAGLVVRRQASARLARRMGTAAAVVVACLSALFLGVPEPSLPEQLGWMPPHLLAMAPFVTALVAVVSVGLAPLRTHRTATLSRMMFLFALAEAFVATGRPIPLALLWSASAAVVWVEIRGHRGDRASTRVFGAYHTMSVLLFGVGALLLTNGATGTVTVGLLMLGIGLREAVVPGHSWFASFVENAPIGIVVAFAAPQLGVYAQLELFAHHDIGAIGHSVAVFGAVTAVLAAMLGVVQTNGRRALAYLMLSQTGLVAYGLESHSLVGYVGTILNWQVLAIATSGFAMAYAALESRRGQLDLRVPSGDFEAAPRLGVAFLVLGFGSVGFPVTLGYVAEDLLLQGTVGEFPYLGMSMVVATALNGINVLRAFLFLFTGRQVRSGRVRVGLTGRESTLFGIAIIALIAFGVFANPLTSFEGARADVAEVNAHQ